MRFICLIILWFQFPQSNLTESKSRLIDNEYNDFAYFTNQTNYWISSQGGWNHYVDKTFNHYKINDPKSGILGTWIQSDLYPDEDGRLYTSTYEYLTIFNPEMDRFISKKIRYKGAEFKEYYHVASIDTSSCELLMSADKHLFFYNYSNDRLETLIDNKTLSIRYSISLDKNIIVGCGVSGSTGIDIYRKNANNGWRKQHVLDSALVDGKIMQTVFIKSVIYGTKAFLLLKKGLIVYDLNTNRIENIHQSESTSQFNSMFQLDDNIYIISSDSGVKKYSINNKGFVDDQEVQYINNKIWSTSPRSIFGYKDDLNNHKSLLISHSSIGVQQINLDIANKCFPEVIYGYKQIPSRIFDWNENVIISDKNKGIIIIDRLGNQKQLKVKDKIDFISNQIIAFRKFKNDLLLFTLKDIYSMNQYFEVRKIFSLIDQEMFLDQSTSYYTDSLIPTLPNPYILNSKHSNISLNKYQSIDSSNQTIHYRFSQNNKKYIINIKGDLFVEYEHKYRYLENIGFCNHLIQANQKTYLSTSKGFISIWENNICNNFDFLTGSNSIYGCAVTNSKELWLTSSDGLIYFDESSCQYTRVFFDSNTKLISSAPISINNELFYLTIEGLKKINTKCYKAFSYVPKLITHHVKVDNIDYNESDLNSIPHDHRLIDISVSLDESLNDSTEQIFYRFADQNWIIAKNNSISLQNLKSSNYKLEILGVGSNRHKSKIKAIEFTVMKPYYLRPWFLISMAGILFSIGYFIQYFNNKRKFHIQQLELDKLTALEKQRQQLSRDLHDEIGSGLSTIKIISSTKSGKEEVYEDIASLSTTLIGNMRDMLWSLDHENDSVDDLVSKIRSSLQTQLKNINIDLKFNIHIAEGTMPIAGLVRRNILLIVKEAIHNVIKHTNARQILVEISDKNILFTIMISDNGNQNSSESSNENKSGKYGLASMRKRALDIGATLDIQNLKTGWSIVIAYPLKSI